MRVVLTHHVTDHAGAFGEGLVGAVAAVKHGVEDPAVYGFQSIPNVREGPPHNHAHCIVQVGPLHF